MPIRRFRLPADLPLMGKLIPQTFQYPENPEWSVQGDEMESITSMVSAAQRLWPLIFALQRVSPAMRDILHGFIWEEDGKPVGIVNASREGSSDDWIISNVGVLPDYRRRGIARKLVEAAVNFTREHRAEHVLLDVLAGNTPAYDLYLSLGFAHYISHTLLRHAIPNAMQEQPLPAKYSMSKLSFQAWQPRYELAHRITPEEIQRYRPVTEQHFRMPASLRLFFPLFSMFSGVREENLLVRTVADKQIVATLRLNAHVRGSGINSCQIDLDPAQSELAPSLAHQALRALQQVSPKCRIEWHIPDWEPALLAAAQANDFTEVSKFHSMGIKL